RAQPAGHSAGRTPMALAPVPVQRPLQTPGTGKLQAYAASEGVTYWYLRMLDAFIRYVQPNGKSDHAFFRSTSTSHSPMRRTLMGKVCSSACSTASASSRGYAPRTRNLAASGEMRNRPRRYERKAS